MRLATLDVGANGSVVKGFGWCGEVRRRVEDRTVEDVLGIGGNEGDKEGLSVGELVVRKERREESKKGGEGVAGVNDGGGEVGLGPLEKGEEGGGVMV